MNVFPCGSQPTKLAPQEYFTGDVLHQRLVEKAAPARLLASLVTFAPGGRTAWHTHPLGQTLYVVSGAGLAQAWGGAIFEIKAGDVVTFEPGEKHWHGAGVTTAMSHVAMHEALDGVGSVMLEQVSEDQYLARK